MGSLTRKIKRRQLLKARKQFMKDFKKSMSKFKKQVACVACSRAPYPGENIDNWHINKYSEKIDLICTECYNEKKEHEEKLADMEYANARRTNAPIGDF